VVHYEAASQGFQHGLQLDQALPNELHPAIRPGGQSIQDLRVEYEGTVDASAFPECMVESGVIRSPQIAPEPHQCGVESPGGHASRRGA